ncbi:MAG: ABC transporter permease [Ignavibacteria bacterium]|nr:ABC transporter permease [Ignavibacteria bacterium]
MIMILMAVTTGLLFSLLALGVFISYRIFDFPDLTVEGSFITGASLTLVLITGGMHPVLATLLGTLGGTCAGAITGALHAAFSISRLLSGIIVMTALFTVNLYILGPGGTIIIMDATSLSGMAETAALSLFSPGLQADLDAMHLFPKDIVIFFSLLVIVGLAVLFLRRFFATHVGLAIRATGENDKMVRAMGINVNVVVVLGLALANTLAALSGGLWAQVLSSVDMRSGSGMIVTGLTSVILGQALFSRARFRTQILGVVLGAVLIRLLISLILMTGVPSEVDKLLQAAFLVLALVLPRTLQKRRAAQAVR